MNALAQQLDPGIHLDQCERKYLLDADAATAFWTVASAHLQPQLDDNARPVQYSRTTYYDTADLAYYRSSKTGVAQRLRVREYAHAASPSQPPVLGDRCYVELKQSSNGLRSKSRVAVRVDDVAAQVALLAGTPLQPCVATWYRRRALTDDAMRLRVTLDDYLLLCRPRPLGSSFADLAVSDILGRGPRYVLEWKSWDAPPAWLTAALAELPEAIGFSKFNLGMSAVEKQSTITNATEAAAAWQRTIHRQRDLAPRASLGQLLSLDEARARLER